MKSDGKVLRTVLCLLALYCGQPGIPANTDTVSVQILCINDFHGSIFSSDEVSGRPVGGAANLAAWLKDRERSNPRTFLVHAGDMVGASQPISALFQDEPTIAILNALGFDAGVPGNHEFDEGLNELLRLQYGGTHPVTGRFGGSSFPLILANVVYAKTGTLVFPPYLIKTVESPRSKLRGIKGTESSVPETEFEKSSSSVIEGIPIAFIGVITSETPFITLPDGIRELDFLDPAASVNHVVSELRQKGIETFVVLAHEGGRQNRKTGRISGRVADMADAVDDAVDVILCGHSHTPLNGLVDGKLVVQANSKGASFADVDLILSRKTGDVVSKKAAIVKTWADQKQADETTADLIAPLANKVQPLLEREICRSASEISKIPNSAGESALGDLIADAHRWAVGTQIAFTNPGGIRRSLPAGTITWGILYETQPFGNRLFKFRMTGDQIVRLLNQQWQANRILQISGIRYSWNRKKPGGNKIVKLTLDNGTPIQKDKMYSVTANEMLASGGDRFSVFQEVAEKEPAAKDLDALVEYLKTMKQPVSIRTDGRIKKIK